LIRGSPEPACVRLSKGASSTCDGLSPPANRPGASAAAAADFLTLLAADDARQTGELFDDLLELVAEELSGLARIIGREQRLEVSRRRS
jgi:hypothetical protein